MTDTPDIELPRHVALAWGVAADPQRGPKREMSVEKIVDAAVQIADADGLAAVSMAAVATRLGYTPMSLYRYVSAKDDLTMLMQESATGLPPESVRDQAGWRARLEALFRAQVQIFLAHPWILDIPITGTPMTPNAAAFMDAMLEALEETPLREEERLAVALLVTGHSRWYGTILAGYAASTRAGDATVAQIAARESAIFEALITADEYPALRRAVDAGVFRSQADPFEFGLQRMLDGVGGYIDRLAAGGSPAPPSDWLALDDADIARDKRYREARKSVREAEKALREARKTARETSREARERVSRGGGTV